MHAHEARFGVRVRGVRNQAPVGVKADEHRVRGTLTLMPIGGGGDPQEVVAELRKQLKGILQPADEAIKRAEGEKRSLTEDEQKVVNESLEKAQPVQEQLATAEKEAGLWQQVKDGIGAVDDGQPKAKTGPQIKTATEAEAVSLGKQFTDSEAYKALLKNDGMKASAWTTGPVDLKATLTEDVASGGRLVQPDVQAGLLPLLFRRLTIADLLASGTTNSNTIRYLKETTATNAAAAVAEGGTKPESTLVFDQVDEAVKKIATILPVTDEMLEDVGQIRSYIDARLRLFIEQTEEDQLLNGSGAGANLTGILNRAGIQTQAKGVDTVIDAIYKAITLVRTNSFLEPDGLVINPADWQDVRLAKDANNNYYGGGPFGPMFGDSLWGLRVVVTPAIAANTALVGAFRAAAQVFRRGGITVEASNSHSTFFAENKTAIRAEERLALAVYRPAGFATVTGI